MGKNWIVITRERGGGMVSEGVVEENNGLPEAPAVLGAPEGEQRQRPSKYSASNTSA